MFVGFNLKINEEFFSLSEKTLDEYREIGNAHLNEYKKNFEEDLEKFIIEKNTISGTELQEEWFPQIKADIFISHSHIDEALALAGWLNKNFKLNCFVDSSVWGYSDNLLATLNDKYSNKRETSNGSYIYSLNSCNKVAQHVNMMLNVALHKMIDKTEAIILLNTSNSVKKFEEKKMEETYSPWLYSELVCSELIRKKSLESYRTKAAMESFMGDEQAKGQLKVVYDVSTEHLMDLSEDDLKNWKQQNSKLKTINLLYNNDLRLEKEDNLDKLYKLKKII